MSTVSIELVELAAKLTFDAEIKRRGFDLDWAKVGDEVRLPYRMQARNVLEAAADEIRSEGMGNVEQALFGTWRGYAEHLQTLGSEDCIKAAVRSERERVLQAFEKFVSTESGMAYHDLGARLFVEKDIRRVIADLRWEVS